MKIPHYLFVLLLISLVFPIPGRASHDIAADLSYEFLNSCTLRVHFNHYVHCAAASGFAHSVSVDNIGGSCTLPSPLTSWIQTGLIERTPICPTANTNCSQVGGNLWGYAQWAFYRDYETCGSNCGQVRLKWSTCCRSYSVSGGQEGWYLGRSVVDLNQSGPSQSPRFLPDPLNMFFAHDKVSHAFRATDADGDSIAYQLDTCFRAKGTPITYGTGITPTQPFGANFDVSLHPQTGVMTIDPQIGAATGAHYFMAIRADEFRNGQQIGSVSFDMEMMVMASAPFNNPGFPEAMQPEVVSGAYLASPGYLMAFPGQPLCLRLITADPDSGQNANLTWDKTLSGPVLTYQPGGTPVDTVWNDTAYFCWTPPQAGTYTFSYAAFDDVCPMPLVNDVGIVVKVSSQPVFQAAALQDSCDRVTFSVQAALGQANAVSWSGTGGLSGSGSTVTHQYPGPGAWPYSVQITDTSGAVIVLNDTVLVSAPIFPLSPQPFQDSCLQASFEVNLPGPGYQQEWWTDQGMHWSTESGKLVFPSGGNFDWWLTVTSPEGCDSTYNGTVAILAPPNPLLLYQGDSLATGTGYLTYAWTLNGQPISGATASAFKPIQDGLYAVTVSDSLGCEVTSNAVQVTLAAVLVQDSEPLQLFPNPFLHSLQLKSIQFRKGSWRMWSSAGKPMRTGRIPASGEVELLVGDLPAGVYLLEIRRGDEAEYRKVLKL